MVQLITRRSLLKGSGALVAAGGLAAMGKPFPARAAAAMPTKLIIDRRTIEVLGKSASVFGIRQADGTPGALHLRWLIIATDEW